MDSSLIAPFVESTRNVFATMLALDVRAGEPRTGRDSIPHHDVSGIIGMSGGITGAVALSFPVETAERVASLFGRAHLDHTREDFADAIGELVNMVAGGARAKFEGESVSVTCPSVIVGGNHTVRGAKDMTAVVIPHTSEVGDFAVELALRKNGRPVHQE